MIRLILLTLAIAALLAWRWTRPEQTSWPLPITPELDADVRDAGWAW